ncbi:3434_t:CDS:2 [Funneliformis mosseae]|uniref:Imidazole glycerol phosphate synthase hisHF n=1 Tax=Funneliformis mosseae TaxID=27381 RepID=A0A9N9AQA5_FUNMO|nr:3434_t:CDS:2 [Funneliformis mosseae]
MGGLYLLDYGAGNVRSLVNAVNKLGYEIEWIKEPGDILKAEKLIFPGVGAFGSAMQLLVEKNYAEPLKQFIASGKQFMGICVGLQALFEGSEENPNISGLGIIPGTVKLFNKDDKVVPHMGWNEANCIKEIKYKNELGQDIHCGIKPGSVYYFVHSYAVPYNQKIKEWILSTTQYGDEIFISSIQKDNVFGTQFHPEKSGYAGLRILKSFLESSGNNNLVVVDDKKIIMKNPTILPKDRFRKRIIACLDVRTNDHGDLVVTKGDQYDVRERTTDNTNGQVRNLGKPVDLARRYFDEGADEITFLNITSFRNCPLVDLPMLEILKRTSETVFVPLTIGGGIRDIIDPDGKFHSALEVAGEYFRSGADKVSIGSDAVYAVENYLANNKILSGRTAIETIAHAYGSQAVVISVDPKRIYVNSPDDEPNHHVIKTSYPGPNGEPWCWYQCTVKGGREGRDIDVHQLVTSCEVMGAGEILLNCMDKDGTNSGYDLELINDVKKAVRIPVIASSGAGKEDHFAEVFAKTNVEAALAAGIFHRREIPIKHVKNYLKERYILIRDEDPSL